MREFKKLASLVLALVMAFALAAPALAADFAQFKEAEGNTTKHELFKVMDADLDGTALKNFSWPKSGAHFDR